MSQPEDVEQLAEALRSGKRTAVLEAAMTAQANEVRELVPELEEAYTALANKSTKSDKGCLAKIALADALDMLEADTVPVFWHGVHHVQMEPVYGGRTDTAANLRARSILGLCRTGHADFFHKAADLLMDPYPQPRRAAVKALHNTPAPESALLLRMKILAGDDEPDVIGDCFSAMMSLEPERSLPFVSDYLDHDELVLVEAAALALGESRLDEALDVLRAAWDEGVVQERKALLLMPIALLRSDAAFAFLLNVVETASTDLARGALEAFEVFPQDDALLSRIRDVVDDRDEPALSRCFNEHL